MQNLAPQYSIPAQALKMRNLAARLRRQAGETAMPEFRRRMESTASDLEEAAVDVESRARASRDRLYS